MLIKAVLNQLENFKGFVFGKVRLRKRWFEKPTLVVDILPRKGSRPGCPVCGRKRSVYDTSRSAREAEYLPLWSYRVVFRFFPRRVNCPWDGIQVEWVPWVNGKEQMTHSYKIFLARWARRLSWNEVAAVFETSWGCVFRAIKMVVRRENAASTSGEIPGTRAVMGRSAYVFGSSEEFVGRKL